jgi:magnesium transporter
VPVDAYTTADVPTVPAAATAADAREALGARPFASATELVVIEDDRLVGLVPIEDLLTAPGGTAVRSLIDDGIPVVRAAAGRALTAHVLGASGVRSLPVVDDDGTFLGLVPATEIVSLLHDEHVEDLARIGGYVAGADRARSAAEESVRKRLAHRLPWLLVGLLGAMASAVLVGAFEEQLNANVLLAFFVPAVVYMADAVGTQTETVLIRGLAAGITPASVLRRELLTGLVTGAIIGVAFLAFALIGWGDPEVAVVVAVALLASCSIATGVAMVLPSIFQGLGLDPAFGSGPLATVVQDLLSIAVYFAAVTVVIR